MEHRASRRELLRITAAGVAAMAATPARMLAQNAAPEFSKPETPEQAMQLLRDGNQRYLQQRLSACSTNLAALREHSEGHQDPFAAILGCADSRVPVEIVFDQSLGRLFVVRVAGNIAAPDTIGSLEYAAAELNIKTILVLGHSKCGAVTAAKAGGAVPGQISTLFQYIYPATVGAADLDAAIAKNAQIQAATLRGASPVIAEMVKQGKLSVQAAVYDVGSGKVTTL
ncbi:MAG TPA: carbonic anhydrase [Acidobacteriaceae bacterium]|jgi:carbonic anhydrase